MVLLSDRLYPPFSSNFYAQIEDEIDAFGRNKLKCRNCPFYDEDDGNQPECIMCLND